MQSYRKLVISLDGAERSALTILAERERRDPHAQAAWLIRRELERVGLLPVPVELIPPLSARDVEVEHERAG